MNKETQTLLEKSVQVSKEIQILTRKRYVLKWPKSTQTSLEISTNVDLNTVVQSKNISHNIKTSRDHYIQVGVNIEVEKKSGFPSGKQMLAKKCINVEQTVKMLSKMNSNLIKFDSKNDDLISISPLYLHPNKPRKVHLSRNNKSDSTNPFFNETMKLYASLTEERLRKRPFVTNSSLLLENKNFYSSSFSMQPGFSFGNLPRKFLPKNQVPGPGSYDVHLMEHYMTHIPGPIYKEPKPAFVPLQKPLVLRKDFKIPKQKSSSKKSTKKIKYNKRLTKYQIVNDMQTGIKLSGYDTQFSMGTKNNHTSNYIKSKKGSHEMDKTHIKENNMTELINNQDINLNKQNEIYEKSLSKKTKSFEFSLTSNDRALFTKQNASLKKIATNSFDIFLSKQSGLPKRNIFSSSPYYPLKIEVENSLSRTKEAEQTTSLINNLSLSKSKDIENKTASNVGHLNTVPVNNFSASKHKISDSTDKVTRNKIIHSTDYNGNIGVKKTSRNKMKNSTSKESNKSKFEGGIVFQIDNSLNKFKYCGKKSKTDYKASTEGNTEIEMFDQNKIVIHYLKKSK